MKVAIMQPYFFPYLGYFQLINAVDRFIIYDDVNFIKQGWINRNNILLNEMSFLFTVPLKNVSSFKLIKDTYVDEKSFEVWKIKFYKNVENAYKKKPNYKTVFAIINDVLNSSLNISTLARESIIACAKYIGIKTEIIYSSSVFNNNHLSGQQRILDICKQTNATEYINAEGGMNLYSREDFKDQNIILKFLKMNDVCYYQGTKVFVPNLSIIDVMMFNDKEQINNLISEYRLI